MYVYFSVLAATRSIPLCDDDVTRGFRDKMIDRISHTSAKHVRKAWQHLATASSSFIISASSSSTKHITKYVALLWCLYSST